MHTTFARNISTSGLSFTSHLHYFFARQCNVIDKKLGYHRDCIVMKNCACNEKLSCVIFEYAELKSYQMFELKLCLYYLRLDQVKELLQIAKRPS